jgi:HSP20 family molecular chaperone IbpA
MSESKEVKTQESQDAQVRSEPETILRPSVDIYEDAQGITLKADLPGVSRDRLNIQVDKDTLALEGQAYIEMPERMDAVYADVQSTRYRRNFTLSDELETDRIDAEMKDGVLTLRIPKRPEVQPRKIEVSAG